MSTEPAQALPPWREALVVGLGRSGRAAVALLKALGVTVRAYDARETVGDPPPGVTLHLGTPQPPDEALHGIDLLVLSPGVPPQEIREQVQRVAPQAAVHGELSLALHRVGLAEHPYWPARPTVLVTGTNGKSTVTALIGALLEAGGRRPFIGGNLGVPLCERLTQTLVERSPWPDSLVLECSSYQLETLPAVPTEVAMVINVSPDHLDRYASLSDYAQTKAKVFAGLSATGLALLDADDPWTERLSPGGPRVRHVGEHGVAWVEGDGEGQELAIGNERYPRASLRIAGGHNARNALFALLAARHLGVGQHACSEGLKRFEGLAHRMVLVRQLEGIDYYNDSKATNVASAMAGLGGLDRPFVLIAGGLHKGDDLEPLRGVLASRGRGLVAIGSSAEQFAEIGEGIVPVARAGDMQDAVAKARALAAAGDVVLLAPACASFDHYRSYAHRGEAFTAAVLELE